MADINTFRDPPALPPDGFNPVDNPADAAKLDQFWLPPKPDPVKQAALFDHWREMLSPPPTFVHADSQPADTTLPRATDVDEVVDPPPPPGHPVASPHAVAFGLPLSPPTARSRNWSGAFLEPAGASRFVRAVAAWTVPSIKPGERSALEPPEVPFRCSIWIGIDGKKTTTHSMPQLGSMHEITEQGAQVHGLWWQWWRRGYSKQDGLPFNVKGVKIDAGDRVMCSLVALSRTSVRMHFLNRTKNLFATLQVDGAAPIKGLTTEWIVERPADFTRAMSPTDPGPLFPLPDFGVLEMDKCVADHGVLPIPAWTPKFVNMVQQFTNPDRRPVISQPSRDAEQGRVRLKYIRP